MNTAPKSWSVRHFSQGNPAGEGQDDVSTLLRRVADTLEQLGVVDVQDLVLHTEVTSDGNLPSLTVYFRTDEGSGELGDKPGMRLR